MMNLVEGQQYLLVGDVKEAGGGDHVRVSTPAMSKLILYLDLSMTRLLQGGHTIVTLL